ncbi:Unknown protein, partial [Striga hermonthica]
PRPVRTPEDKLDKTRYCAYHKSPGHNTDECLGLLSSLLQLIGQPQLQKFRNFDNRWKGRPLYLSDDEDDDNRPVNQKRARANDKEVFTFSTHVGTSTDNCRKSRTHDALDSSHYIPRVNSNNKQLDTSRRKVKAYAREAQNAEKRVMNVDLRDTINKQNCPITFSIEDANLFAHPHSDALIITAPIGGIPVHRILVDTGAYSSILMLRTFKKLGLDPADIRPCNDQIQGFNGSISCPVGKILLPIRFGGFGPKSKIIMETFKVLDVQNEYNVVIGRTALYKLRAAVSIFHYALKFPTIEGEGTHYGDQREARSLMLLSTSPNFHMIE